MNHLHGQMLDHLPRLRRFARALTGDVADADDLVQATVEKALRSVASFREGTRMDSWMFKIAQNLWIDQKRSADRKGVSVGLEDAVGLVGEDGRKTVERNRLLADVRAAIAELPEPQRLVVAYVLVDGQSYKEAAGHIGIPVGTLMSRLSRARKALEARVFTAGGVQ